MKYDFEKLLTEQDFANLKRQIEKFALFEFVRLDKVAKVELRISGRESEYQGYWQDNYFCTIDGSKKHGDYYGFGLPFQRTEFLKLTYNDIAKCFVVYGFGLPEVKQLNMFAII